jgi:2-iminobutanoate/2-iminopropanoate deaminase
VGILKEAGVGMDRVVKVRSTILPVNLRLTKRIQVNVFLDDMAHFAEMNGVFEKYFAHKPARSCVAVKQLPKGVPVEIECIAYTGEVAKL